jgi:hypothetical protein
MKGKKVYRIIVLILIMILVVPFSTLTNAWNIAQEETDTGSGELSIDGREYFYRTFYSNYSKRFYSIFAYTGVGWGQQGIMYTMSVDGVGWTHQTNEFPTPIDGIGGPLGQGLRMGRTIDFFITPDGKYIYYAGEEWADNDALWWGKVEINQSTGELYSVVDAVQILDGQYGGGVDPIWGTKECEDEYSIVTDSESYVYIGMEVGWGAGQKSYMVIKSNAPDSFTFESFGDSWLIESEYIANGGPNVGNIEHHGQLFPMHESEDVGIVWGYYENAGIQELHRSLWYDNSTDDWITMGGSIFNDNEGGDWRDDCWGLGWSSDLAVIFKQHESNPDGQIGLEAKFLNEVTNTWENQTQISFDLAGDAGAFGFRPLVSVREGSNAVNFVWSLDGNSTSWIRRMYPNGTFEDTKVFSSDMGNLILNNQFSSGAIGLGPMGVTTLINEGTTDGASLPWVGDFIMFDYETFLEDDWSPPYQHLNTTLEGDGWILDDEWIFMGEKYIFISYVINASTFELFFNDGYDTHTIRMEFDNETERLSTSNDERDEFVTGLYFSNYTLMDDGITQEIIWGWIPDKNIIDDVNVLVSYTITNDEFFNISTTASTGISFHIYNLGGLVAYDFNGGGRVTGGEPFELWCDDGAGFYAYSETIFRKLQHVHFLAELDYDPTWYSNHWDDFSGGGWITYGIDYRINSTWIEGWECQIYIQPSQVGHFGGATDASFIRMNVEWYNQGVKIKENDIYAYSYGYYPQGKNESDRTTFNFWVDLWFNKLNSSSVIGGRVNAYQYGMREEGWWMWANVNPVIGNVTASMFFDDLKDGTGNVTTVRNIELMRFRTTINRTVAWNSRWLLYPYEVFNYKTADDRMMGVDTPVFVETTVIDMPKTGFVAPIVKAIQGISTAITRAMFNVIKMMIGALDTLLVDILHSPVSMSQMIEWIMLQGQYITEYLSTVLLYVSQMLTVFSHIIEFVVSIVTYFVNVIVWVLTTVVPFPLHVIRFIIAIINGVPYTIGDWTWDLGNYSELIQGALTIGSMSVGYAFVMWVLWGNMYAEGEMDMEGMPKRIIMIFQYLRETFTSIFWIFNRMRNEIISLYNFIRSHIPQIGGGGGETVE